MKILLRMAVVQSVNLVIFAWFNRVASRLPADCVVVVGPGSGTDTPAECGPAASIRGFPAGIGVRSSRHEIGSTGWPLLQVPGSMGLDSSTGFSRMAGSFAGLSASWQHHAFRGHLPALLRHPLGLSQSPSTLHIFGLDFPTVALRGQIY